MPDNQPTFKDEELKMPTIVPGEAATAKTIISAPILIILTIVLMIILGGIFYLSSLNQTPQVTEVPPLRPTAEMNQEPETPTATAQVESLGALSTSDEVVTIEADLEATPLDNLDAELLQIEAELNSEI